METSIIREKLHQFIDEIEDNKVEAIYTLFENEIDPETSRKKLILAEREKFLTGQGKTYDWEQVNRMAIQKEKRHVL